MHIGTVKWFNAPKGYGFIEPLDRSPDVFVHRSAVRQAELDNLSEGQRIEYNIRKDADGRESAVDLFHLK
ncbi:MAG: cold shock domain-containing protein [Rhodospirillales bacterium]|nr:cold shock domain-containing protein [Rhodospirillales bacterium]